MDVPAKTLWGHGGNTIHRRYETPQMYVFLTLFRDHPIEPKRPLSMVSERSCLVLCLRDVRVFVNVLGFSVI